MGRKKKEEETDQHSTAKKFPHRPNFIYRSTIQYKNEMASDLYVYVCVCVGEKKTGTSWKKRHKHARIRASNVLVIFMQWHLG